MTFRSQVGKGNWWTNTLYKCQSPWIYRDSFKNKQQSGAKHQSSRSSQSKESNGLLCLATSQTVPPYISGLLYYTSGTPAMSGTSTTSGSSAIPVILRIFDQLFSQSNLSSCRDLDPLFCQSYLDHAVTGILKFVFKWVSVQGLWSTDKAY